MIAVNVKYGDSSRQIYFPCQEGVLSRTLLELQVPEEKWVAPKLFVDEVVNYDELKGIEGDFIDLDELNYLAKRLESFDKKELMKFNAAVSISGMRTMPDLINLTFNEQYYTLIQDASNPERVGKEHFMTRNGGMSEKDALDYDFAKIGKDIIESGKGKMTAYGLLIVNDDLPYERPYNGRNFPAYYYEPKMLGMRLKYNGNEEFVYLPDNPITVKKAVKRLDAENVEECSVDFDLVDPDSEELKSILKGVLENEGIYALNVFANTLKTHCRAEDIRTLPSIIEYADSHDFDTLVMIVENIQKFTVIPDVEYDEELGRTWMDEYTEFSSQDEIMDYFNFEAYGKALRQEMHGRYMGNGNYICINEGISLEELLERTIAETSEMTMGGM